MSLKKNNFGHTSQSSLSTLEDFPNFGGLLRISEITGNFKQQLTSVRYLLELTFSIFFSSFFRYVIVILDYGFILGISDNNCGNFDVGHKKRFLQLHYPIPGPAEPGGKRGICTQTQILPGHLTRGDRLVIFCPTHY